MHEQSMEKYIREAKNYPWEKRTIPRVFSPLQQNSQVRVSCCDWWNTRSQVLCCLFPCANCITGATTIDGTDPSVWKHHLEKYQNGPESMRGLWWLKYNHAHEQLVTIFNETDFLGEVNEDGTEGVGRWQRSLGTNWSRDKTCFGYVLLMFPRFKPDIKVAGLYNLKEGILTLDPGHQWVFRVNDNEWWKIHYDGKIGEEGEQDPNFMYKWLKVLDKDGNPTEHWDEYVQWSKDPLPHTNCGDNWFICWGCGLSRPERFENMCRPNPKQIVMFRE